MADGTTLSGRGGPAIAGLWRGASWLIRSSWMLLLFLVLWEIYFQLNESLFVPPMTDILGRMFTKWFSTDPSKLFTSDFFRIHAFASLTRFAWGWGVAVLVGIGGGLLLGSSRTAEASFKWLVRFGVSTPSTILLPVALVIFGVTDRMNIFLIATGAVWPILLNTIDGVRGIDPAVLGSGQSLRLPRWTQFRKVTLRAASPQIFAGLRISLGVALILVVISEIFVATKGIGFDIIISQRTFAFAEMWASVAFLGVLAIVFNALFHVVERALLGWHRAQREGAS